MLLKQLLAREDIQIEIALEVGLDVDVQRIHVFHNVDGLNQSALKRRPVRGGRDGFGAVSGLATFDQLRDVRDASNFENPIRMLFQLRYAFQDTAPDSDRKSTRLNSSHLGISYAVFCLKK